MKTGQIIELLEKEFKGKKYIISKNDDLNINIEIPAGNDFEAKSEKIFEGIILMKPLFVGVTKLNVTISQSNTRELIIGA